MKLAPMTLPMQAFSNFLDPAYTSFANVTAARSPAGPQVRHLRWGKKDLSGEEYVQYARKRGMADANGDGTVSGSEAAWALLPLSGLWWTRRSGSTACSPPANLSGKNGPPRRMDCGTGLLTCHLSVRAR